MRELQGTHSLSFGFPVRRKAAILKYDRLSFSGREKKKMVMSRQGNISGLNTAPSLGQRQIYNSGTVGRSDFSYFSLYHGYNTLKTMFILHSSTYF